MNIIFPAAASIPETDGDKKSFPAAISFLVTDSFPETDGEEPTP